MENVDLTGADALAGMFDDIAIEETPEEETPPIVETPLEEVPAVVETPAEETPKEEIPVEVPEGYVPIPVHAELRAKARDKENELRQQLSASQIAQAKAEAKAELLEQMAVKPNQDPPPPPEKSPLEVFEEEYPGEAVTAKVLLEQRRWDSAQTEQQAAQTRTQTQGQQVEEGITLARNTYSAEKMGSEELTLDAVVGLARSQGLVTEKDVANLAPYGKRAGTVLYNLATSAIKQAGGASLQELNRRVIAARQSLATKNGKPTNPKPPVKPVVPAAPAGKEPKVEEDDGDISEITDWMFA